MVSPARRRVIVRRLRDLMVPLLAIAIFGESVAGGGAEPGGGRDAAAIPLRREQEIVPPGALPGLVVQLCWTGTDRVLVLLARPFRLLEIDLVAGHSNLLAQEGPGPFDLDPSVNLLSSTRPPLLHAPESLRTLVLESPLRMLQHERSSVAAQVGDDEVLWLCPGPMRIDQADRAGATVSLVRTAATSLTEDFVPLAGGADEEFEHVGDVEEVMAAQYFTRLLAAGEAFHWKVVLGHAGRVDRWSLDASAGPQSWDFRPRTLIEASSSDEGRLHLLVGDPGESWGSRVVRLDPSGQRRPDWIYGTAWSVGVVGPGGDLWLAVEGDTGAVALYRPSLNPRRR